MRGGNGFIFETLSYQALLFYSLIIEIFQDRSEKQKIRFQRLEKSNITFKAEDGKVEQYFL